MEDKIYKIINDLMAKKYSQEIGMYQEDFEDIVKAFDMKCKYLVREISGQNVIVETWSSDQNPFISLNKIFDINSDNLSKIDPKKRKKLLQKILDKEIEVENYEQAAVVRDLITDITE
jgi:hypothetical protein